LVDFGNGPELIRADQVAISDTLPDLLRESRDRGLSGAEAYAVVIELFEHLVSRAYRAATKNILLDMNRNYRMLTVDSRKSPSSATDLS
jgi:hypothetical protein